MKNKKRPFIFLTAFFKIRANMIIATNFKVTNLHTIASNAF